MAGYFILDEYLSLNALLMFIVFCREQLPITLKVPRFNPSSVRHCNLYSLLGFGDMLAPGNYHRFHVPFTINHMPFDDNRK